MPATKTTLATAVATLAVTCLAVPAAADAATFCVAPATGCDTDFTAGQAQQALNAAGAASTDDTVRLGASTYSGALIYTRNASSGADTIAGAGKGQTVITAPAAANLQILRVFGMSGTGRSTNLRDLTITVPANGAVAQQALTLQHATGQDLDVNGPGTDNALGVTLQDGTLTRSTVTLPLGTPSGDRGVSAYEDSLITDSALTAGTAADVSGSGTTATISRSRITSTGYGLKMDSGTASVDDTVVDLGSGSNAIGFAADNPNNGVAPKTLNLRHVTVVGGGANSTGLRVAATAPGAVQSSTATLADSVIAGPATPILRTAGTAAASTSTASVTTRYSNYNAAADVSSNTANGAGAITEATPSTNASPGFVNAAGGDYRLAAGSALIDAGDPAAGGPSLDLASAARVQDGNGDGVARRDIGAYEHPAPPATPAGSGQTSGGGTGTSKPGSPAAVDRTKPALGSIGLSSSTFRAATSGASTSARRKKAPIGTKLSFTLSERGSVRFTVERKTSGRRAHYVKVAGSFTVTGKAGRTRVTFRGRLRGKALKPGRYRLTGRATDAAGNRSVLRRRNFTVVK